MTRALDRRLHRLEAPPTSEPLIGDWLDWLDADDRAAADADLIRRFPIVATADYRSPAERLPKDEETQ